MPLVLNPASGTYSHPSGVGESTAITFAPTQNNIVKGIWLDLVNLTQNATIRAQYQIDGTNYRTFQVINWTTGMEDGVLVEGELPVNDNVRITIQSVVAEGVSRNIPYQLWYEGLGAGALTFTYTLTNSVTGVVIQNAEVWVTTDAAGNNIIASGLTNASGQIVLYLDAGTYYLWRQHPQYTFTDPDIEVIA